MSRRNCKILDTGNEFPKLSFKTVEQEVVNLPEDFEERWNILLFYRGHW